MAALLLAAAVLSPNLNLIVGDKLETRYTGTEINWSLVGKAVDGVREALKSMSSKLFDPVRKGENA